MENRTSSETLYAALEAGCQSPKAARSLVNIKAAVDLVLKGSRELTLAAVAKVCLERFGGPKYQSICNRQDYRAYINARFTEARASSFERRTGKLPPAEAEASLEFLRAENRALAAENTRLKKAFRSLAPVPINVLLGKADALPDPAAALPDPLGSLEKQDIRKFLNETFDLGYDIASDGRLITTRGLTVIGAAGMTALKRLTET